MFMTFDMLVSVVNRLGIPNLVEKHISVIILHHLIHNVGFALAAILFDLSRVTEVKKLSPPHLISISTFESTHGENFGAVSEKLTIFGVNSPTRTPVMVRSWFNHFFLHVTFGDKSS